MKHISAIALSCLLLPACLVDDLDLEDDELADLEDEIGESSQEVLTSNGMSLNGMSLNGMSLNGMSLNGMSLNGMSLNGMSLNGMSLNGMSLNGSQLNGVKFDRRHDHRHRPGRHQDERHAVERRHPGPPHRLGQHAAGAQLRRVGLRCELRAVGRHLGPAVRRRRAGGPGRWAPGTTPRA